MRELIILFLTGIKLFPIRKTAFLAIFDKIDSFVYNFTIAFVPK